MDRETFAELRQIAARKRDESIEKSREDYKRSIAEIARLEHHLIGEIKAQRPVSKSQLKLQDLICSIVPGDCAFSIDDVCGFIASADPEREFAKGTVRTVLYRLYKEKTIKRVTDASGVNVVTYSLPDYEPPADQRSMADWAELILCDAGKPMKAVEIMVAMTEQGYEMACEPAQAVQHLVWAMERDDRFSLNGQSWSRDN